MRRGSARDKLAAVATMMRSEIRQILSLLNELVAGQRRIIEGQQVVEAQGIRIISQGNEALGLLQTIAAELAPPIPVAFRVTLISGSVVNLIEGENMKPLKAAASFTILDDGTATLNINLLDGDGLPATLPTGASLSALSCTPSAPTIVVTPATTPTALSAAVAPASAAVLTAPGAVLTAITIAVAAITMTLANGTTSTLPTETTEPINITGDVPTGFALSLTTP